MKMKKTSADKLKCRSCGAILPKAAKYCVNCGKPVINPEENRITENQADAICCPNGHGPLKPWDGLLRCWECGWSPANSNKENSTIALKDITKSPAFLILIGLIDIIGWMLLFAIGLLITFSKCHSLNMSILLTILSGIVYYIILSIIWDGLNSRKYKFIRPGIVLIFLIVALITNPTENQHQVKIYSQMQQSIRANSSLLAASLDKENNLSGDLLLQHIGIKYYNFYLLSFTTLKGFGLLGLSSVGFMNYIYVLK